MEKACGVTKAFSYAYTYMYDYRCGMVWEVLCHVLCGDGIECLSV